MPRIACPSCNSSLTMPESMYGRKVKCPKCNTPFQCPTPSGSAPAPAPVAGTEALRPERLPPEGSSVIDGTEGGSTGRGATLQRACRAFRHR